MTVNDIRRILDAEVYCCPDKMDVEILTAYGSDLMSDVLAFVQDQSVLLSGMLNSQVIRTAEMMDISCVVFVRGKIPDESIVELAAQKGICVLATKYQMFTACGLLYSSGLIGDPSQ